MPAAVPDRDEGDIGWGLDGESLHFGEDAVPADCWCVTRADFHVLRRKVRGAIAEGLIRPTERDPFDPADEKTGPNMHTVVCQYIKPLTAAAGGMSWALLRHPEGLKCDLFLTHCWAEGVFELIDSVLASWPVGKMHAWCCALANPQNLKLGALISEPRKSPFAKALGSASYVMVVPTRRCSIYTRVWCVYEAYLASVWGKGIFMARPPVSARLIAMEFLWNFLPFAAGFGLGALFDHARERGHLRLHAAQLCLLLATMSAFIIIRFCFTRCKAEIAKAFVPIMLLMTSFSCMAALRPPLRMKLVIHVALGGLANALDAILDKDADAARAILLRGFHCIAEAEASDPEDKRHILSDIGHEKAQVHESLEILCSAGMSTPELCQVVEAGANVEGWNYDVQTCMLALGLWPLQSAVNVWQAESRATAGLAALDLALVLSASMACCCALPDRQVFIAKSVFHVKLWVVLLYVSSILAEWVPDSVAMSLIVSLCFASSVLLFSVAIAGPHRVARLPRVGPQLVDWLTSGPRALLCPRTAADVKAVARGRSHRASLVLSGCQHNSPALLEADQADMWLAAKVLGLDLAAPVGATAGHRLGIERSPLMPVRRSKSF